jgi:chromosome segregation ATPase
MADVIIETQIDELAKLVSERKKITVSDAASLLKTSETQVEEWVRILEDSGYVQLTYPALGEPIIIIKEIKKSDLEKKKGELDDRKDAIEGKTKEFQKKVDVVEKRVQLSAKEFSELDDVLKKKLADLDKSMKVVDKLDDQKKSIEKSSGEMKSQADSVCNQIDQIKSDIVQMENKINDHIKAMEKHDTDVKALDESKKVIEGEIAKLESDIKLIKIIANRPVKVQLTGIKSIFARHKEKAEKVVVSKKKLHAKVLKAKEKVVKKKKSKGLFKFFKK